MENINFKKNEQLGGFTLIEILVVIGIIAILASVVLVAINPIRQFKLARDSQRISNVNSILNAIDQNISEHGGIFMCNSTQTTLPASTSDISSISTTTLNSIDLAPCLVPAYIAALPFDPSNIFAHYVDTKSYDTQYFVSQDSEGRITVSANGEITSVISVSR